MAIKIPHDLLTLQLAALKLARLTEEDADRMIAKLDFLKMESQADKNKKAAEFHGITVETLVGSASYEKLESQFEQHMAEKGVAIMKEELSLTDEEAWAIVYFGINGA